MWVAKEKNGKLWLFNRKPNRCMGEWLLSDDDLITGGFRIPLENFDYPYEVSWNNNPIEVTLIPKITL